MESIEIILRAYAMPMSARQMADILYGWGSDHVQTENKLEELVGGGNISVDDFGDETVYYYDYQVKKPHYYYVHQGRSFEEECSEGFLRAPKNGKNGRFVGHWDRLKYVKKGDIILHGGYKKLLGISVAKTDAYSFFWNNDEGGFDGWRVDSYYFKFKNTIQPQDFWENLKILVPSSDGPFNYKGGGNQGYLFEANQKMTAFLIDRISGSMTQGTVSKSSKTSLSVEKKVVDEDSEIGELLDSNSEVVLAGYIAQFKKDLPEIKKEEKELEELRKKFVDDYFSVESIKQMPMEDYVIGIRKDSFCYRLENELVGLGNIHGTPAYKFGLYYGKSGDDTTKKYRYVGSLGDSPEEVFQEVKCQIIMLRMAGDKGDVHGIENCKLSKSMRGKILSTFFPEKYLPIFSEVHLDYFLGKLGLTVDPQATILDKQTRILNWKNEIEYFSDLSNYLFMRFLYASFKRPTDDADEIKDAQEKRDKEYPREYVSSVKINIDQWVELLKDQEVFHERDLEFIKRIYLCDNHATSCYDLGLQDGVHPTSYTSMVVALAKRVAEKTGIDPVIKSDGGQIWWRILFWGRYREDTHFEWKLQPKLAKAIKKVFPELEIDEINDEEDNKLIEELKPASLANADDDFDYCSEPKKKPAPVYTNGHKTYPRDRQTAINALAHSHYKCEYDSSHPTFIRKHSNKPYTEPHHLVPMSFSDDFKVSLDREQNIVSLCSNCHNQIHYGRDAAELVKKLYEARKEDLESVGIKVSLDDLYGMYHISANYKVTKEMKSENG